MAAATQQQPREQRRVVTILFADLVGFTSRAEQLDPEDVRALLSPYYQSLRDQIESHGGTVEKFIGDAVVGVFGAPVAHGDDPERGVRAALGIRDLVLQAEPPGRAGREPVPRAYALRPRRALAGPLSTASRVSADRRRGSGCPVCGVTVVLETKTREPRALKRPTCVFVGRNVHETTAKSAKTWTRLGDHNDAKALQIAITQMQRQHD